MDKKIKLVSAVVVVIIIGLMTAFLIYKFSPSKEMMELSEYYNLTSEEEMAVFFRIQYRMKRDYIQMVYLISAIRW